MKHLFFFMMCFVSPFCHLGQNLVKFVPLQTGEPPLTPTHFYIEKVSDIRNNASRIGHAFGADNTLLQLKPSISLSKYGRSFFHNPVRRDTLDYAITIHIKNLDIQEKIKDNMIHGECSIELAFSFTRAGTDVVFTSFKSKTLFKRSFGEYDNYQKMLERLFRRGAEHLNQWMSVNYDKNPILARSLVINILPDYRIDNPDKGDTLFWSPSRPLRWSDFHGKPPVFTSYSAQVFSNFEYIGDVKFSKGVLTANLQFKAYVLKSSSWNAHAGNSESALDHEQLHFDITKTIIEKFKEKAQQITSVEDYDSEIQLLFIDMYRLMNKLQKKYDAETNHSINMIDQERWRMEVRNELRGYGI
ncbi:hypothetical protein [Flectobacillus roseus]|uniref:hypothetical protein n=1 Tax=Flectobacillus roseus TaxID=502259 RepID=UPI0024B6CE21|nr:hypothetical protein [Flectobacillus roseus]MDI9868077.1 hypothetical protein [Flectobacillus roseus]